MSGQTQRLAVLWRLEKEAEEKMLEGLTITL